MDSFSSKGKSPLKGSAPKVSGTNETEENSDLVPGNDGIPNMQKEDSAQIQSSGLNYEMQLTLSRQVPVMVRKTKPLLVAMRQVS